jgi:hypothetical protein
MSAQLRERIMPKLDATTVEEEDDSLHFVLRMAEAGELFTAPDFDPFQAQLRTTAGVEDIADELRMRRIKRVERLDAALILPQDRITPGLDDDIHAAIGRYCDREIEAARRRIVITRTTGHTQLPSTVAVSVGVILLSLVLSGILRFLLPPLIDSINALLAGIATITIWVAVWQPVETIFFDPWADQRDIRIYTKIKEMEIRIQPA